MRVTESMGPAWETMKRILFRPFNLGTWFSFGFIFFLQSCVEGGGGNSFNIPRGGSSGRGHHDGDTGNDIAALAHDFVASITGPLGDALGSPDEARRLATILPFVVIIVAIPVVLLMYWLGTRGQMMAIRAVATGQANIGDAWRNTKGSAGSLFRFDLVIIAISFVIFVPLAVGALFIALPAISAGQGIEESLPALIVLGVIAVVLMFPLMLVGAMARNFVAPIMLKHGIGAREGWKRFWAVGKNQVGSIVVFYLLRIVVAVGAGIIGVIAGVLTCCLGLLPFLHQTLMAPYYVFERAWTLEVLASMSPDFDLRGMGDAPPPPVPYGGGGVPFNPYAGPPTDNPYAPPGYGGGGGGGSGGPPPGGFGAPP